MLSAEIYHDHIHTAPADTISLTYEGRFLRRRVLTSDGGERFLLDLPQTTSLDHGGAVALSDGRLIQVKAAPEPLLAVTGTDTAPLPQLAWHIGNRHAPCQVEAARLLIRPDHVLRDMLEKLGAGVAEVCEPFTPLGGAYGHGRTHAHSH